jgi:hypothetical protein
LRQLIRAIGAIGGKNKRRTYENRIDRNGTGHMTVAYVAYPKLTPQTRARVDQLLTLNPMYATPCEDNLHAYWDDLLGTKTDVKTITGLGIKLLQQGKPQGADIADVNPW